MKPEALLSAFRDAGISCFFGVPDSTLATFTQLLDGNGLVHRVSVNEGTAVAEAIGTYLATGECAVVYLQNSGLGNAINPLLTLAAPEAMGIPLVLLIGWRGAPGFDDEPQHRAQGRVTPALLDAMDVAHVELDDETFGEAVARAVTCATADCSAYALLVRPGVLPSVQVVAPSLGGLSRERAIEVVLKYCGTQTVVVATTGRIGREVYESRERLGLSHDLDVLVVGAMGHASTIGAAIATAQGRRVVVLDGDGAALMHMGAMATIGSAGLRNFVHVLLNNRVHESVGGQPTSAPNLDFAGVAKACGYDSVMTVADEDELSRVLVATDHHGALFVHTSVSIGSRPDLGRPLKAPAESVDEFRRAIQRSDDADTVA